MKHLVILFQLLCLIGISVILKTLSLRKPCKNQNKKKPLFTGIMLSIVLSVLTYYLRVNIPVCPEGVIYFLTIGNNLTFLFTLYYLISLVFPGTAGRMTWGAGVIVVTLALLSRHYIPLFPEMVALLFPSYIYLSSGMLLLYTGLRIKQIKSVILCLVDIFILCISLLIFFFLVLHRSQDPVTLLNNYCYYFFIPLTYLSGIFFYLLESGGGVQKLPVVPSRQLPLTAREKEIAVRILEGLSNAEVARELNISYTTVKTHMRNIYQKLDINSKIELVRFIYEQGE